MRKNIVKEKSFAFALRVVNCYNWLFAEKKKFVMSKQLLRSGSSVSTMVREAEHAKTKKDFIHNTAIAQKEINESIYWSELYRETNYLGLDHFKELEKDAIEIIKLITSIIKSSKAITNH